MTTEYESTNKVIQIIPAPAGYWVEQTYEESDGTYATDTSPVVCMALTFKGEVVFMAACRDSGLQTTLSKLWVFSNVVSPNVRSKKGELVENLLDGFSGVDHHAVTKYNLARYGVSCLPVDSESLYPLPRA